VFGFVVMNHSVTNSRKHVATPADSIKALKTQLLQRYRAR
jgi:hypothetical protein